MAFRVFLVLCVRRHNLRELQLSFRDCSRLVLTTPSQPSPEGSCWSESTHLFSFTTQACFRLSSKSLVSSHGMGHLRPSTGGPASSREIRRPPGPTPHRSGSSTDASNPIVQPEGQSLDLLTRPLPLRPVCFPEGSPVPEVSTPESNQSLLRPNTFHRVRSCSDFVLSLHLAGFLRVWSAGLLRPAASHGLRCVWRRVSVRSDCVPTEVVPLPPGVLPGGRSPSCPRKGQDLPRNAVPFEVFPSSVAATCCHATCPPAVPRSIPLRSQQRLNEPKSEVPHASRNPGCTEVHPVNQTSPSPQQPKSLCHLHPKAGMRS